MATFTCGNCGKDASITEQTKVHWAMGIIGLLISAAIVIGVLFKLLGQALA